MNIVYFIYGAFNEKKGKTNSFSFSAPITKTADHSMCTMHYIAETYRTLETEQYGASVQPVRYLHHLDALTPFLA